MTDEEKCVVINLKGEMELTLFDPLTGETLDPEELSQINHQSYNTLQEAVLLIERLVQERDAVVWDLRQIEHGKIDYPYATMPCNACLYNDCSCANKSSSCKGFKWRGVCVQNTEGEKQ